MVLHSPPMGSPVVPGSRDMKPVLEHRSAITRALTRWGRRNARAYPWREELPLWQALIAEVMLQRTRAEQVVLTFNQFRERLPQSGRARASQRQGTRRAHETARSPQAWSPSAQARAGHRTVGRYAPTGFRRRLRRYPASDRTQPPPRSRFTRTAGRCSSTRTSCACSAGSWESRTTVRHAGSAGSARWPKT